MQTCGDGRLGRPVERSSTPDYQRWPAGLARQGQPGAAVPTCFTELPRLGSRLASWGLDCQKFLGEPLGIFLQQ
jgi:hypothetical protein